MSLSYQSFISHLSLSLIRLVSLVSLPSNNTAAGAMQENPVVAHTPQPGSSGVAQVGLLEYKLVLGVSIELGIHNPPLMGPEPLVVLQKGENGAQALSFTCEGRARAPGRFLCWQCPDGKQRTKQPLSMGGAGIPTLHSAPRAHALCQG